MDNIINYYLLYILICNTDSIPVYYDKFKTTFYITPYY